MWCRTDGNVILNGKDTMLTGFTEATIKMVVWYDSSGCATCNATFVEQNPKLPKNQEPHPLHTTAIWYIAGRSGREKSIR